MTLEQAKEFEKLTKVLLLKNGSLVVKMDNVSSIVFTKQEVVKIKEVLNNGG